MRYPAAALFSGAVAGPTCALDPVDWRMVSGGALATYPKLPWAELPY